MDLKIYSEYGIEFWLRVKKVISRKMYRLYIKIFPPSKMYFINKL